MEESPSRFQTVPLAGGHGVVRGDRVSIADVVDVSVLQEIQDSFADLARVGIVIRDTEGNMVTRPSRLNEFCQLLLDDAALQRMCRECHTTALDGGGSGAKDEGDHGLIRYHCHAGLLQFASPIVAGGRAYGAIIVGPVAEDHVDLEEVRPIADHLGMGAEEVHAHLQGLRRWREPEIRELMRSLAFVTRTLTDLCLTGVELQATVDELRLVRDIGRELTSQKSLHEALNYVARRVTLIFNAKGCLIRLFVSESGHAEVLASYGLSQQYLNKGPVSIAQELDRAALDGSVFTIEDVTQDPAFRYPEEAQAEGLRSAIYAELVSKGRPLGTMRIYTADVRQFAPSDLRLLSALASQAALALENADLIDSLRRTNRRLREAYEITRATQERLVQAEHLAQIGEMAGGIAHEVKNPQSAVYGLARALRDHYDELTQEQVNEFLTLIMEESKRTTELVDSIRQFARGRSAGFARVSLASVVHDVTALERFDSALRRVDVEADVDEELAVEGNADRLKQVLLNIIQNAGQAMRSQTDARICVTARRHGEQVWLSVADNGPGIPQEEQARIWEPFYTTRGEEGTGLGLDICRQIVAQHGGTIDLESTPGAGATFTVKLPLARDRDGVEQES